MTIEELEDAITKQKYNMAINEIADDSYFISEKRKRDEEKLFRLQEMLKKQQADIDLRS